MTVIDRQKFFAALRKRDGLRLHRIQQDQVVGIDGLIDAFEAVGDGDLRTFAYGLATAYHETGHKMVPVVENMNYSASGLRKTFRRYFETDAIAKQYERQPQRIANRAYANRNGNGNEASGDGWRFRGRGHVQLTGKANYRISSPDAGADLVANPEHMLEPVPSARVLYLGLLDGRWNGRGHGVRHYLDRDDPVGARYTVNIQDKAKEIAAQYREFLAAARAAA